MRAATSQGSDWARFRPGPIEGVTRMDAHFQDHAFERHSHATYSIGLTHSGVQTFHCGGELHASLPGDLILFNPDQAHDGQRGAPEGFGYSILYVTADAIAQCLDPAAGIELPRHFRRPVVRDAAIARRFAQALAALAQPGESLRAEELSRSVFTGILARHGEAGTRRTNALSAGELRMAQVRDYLHNHYAQDLTTQQLAAVAGLSRAHLTAAFTRHFGMPPHVYLNAVRVRQAQLAMLSGEPLAEVATACGFADQSHLSRRFKGAVGTSPADWLRQMRAAS
jgi:AraC-like DNA-binding protein